MFLKAANATMLKAYVVKPVVLDDMKNLMFSCEMPCDTLREFRKFFPLSIELLIEALKRHRKEMKKLIIPANDDCSPIAGTVKSDKIVS